MSIVYPLKGIPKETPRDKLLEVQEQADTVKNTLRINIEKVTLRGEELEKLDDKTIELERSAAQFNRNAKKLKMKMWCQNHKFLFIFLLIFVIVLFILLAAGGAFN